MESKRSSSKRDVLIPCDALMCLLVCVCIVAPRTKLLFFFQLYGSYIREYRKAQAFIDVLVDTKRKFLDWLDLNELCCGYSLKQLLLAPVSRMPQYLIFLGQYSSNICGPLFSPVGLLARP